MTGIPTLETDVLVCGAGIAGLTAARTAQEAGARVVVLEKGPETGGSSAVSAGIVWTARDLVGWLSVQPGGDPTLGKAQVTTYPEAIEWLRSQDVRLEPFEFGASGWNPPFPYLAFQLEPGDDGRSNPRAAMDRLTANVTAAGGRIFTETAIRDFLQDASGRVIGAEARGPDGLLRISAKATVMATGGFQGSPELRARYFGPNSDRMILRANPYSTGEAFQAALAAGAGTAGPFSRFYGHRVVAPPAVVDFPSFPRVHLGGALPGAILVNLRGERYVDESQSDEVSVHALPHQPEALGFMIYSESDAATDVGSAALETVRSVGTEILEAPSLDSLAQKMSTRWGVARGPLLNSLGAYNIAADAGDATLLAIPRASDLHPLTRPPFYAIRFLPGITVTYGGVRIDAFTRVLDSTGRPLGGLYAAGADAGGIYTRGYAGGLSVGLAFGRIAGREAAASALLP